MTRGLLLFAHGARDPRWALPFEDVAQRVRAAHPGVPVALAFLEFMAPDLREAGRQLAAQGCTRVDVLPLFLGAGGHVRKDLPELLDDLSATHAGVRWQLHPAVGELDPVIAAMADAAGRLIIASTDTK
ncbi:MULTISPECIES: sirohydrochlorin chelatase [unclassified Rhizobacter]|uniref:sirohydrochlorin chelatase n=1 Tax=unclassified Rhizobacter TaxID=2640088 RepID=UPI0006F5312A|nr:MULTISPECIES: CbiX/SirB N-terminal domain-containing protein [unclassified Rhizobacter]KQU66132.1 cobalamin biosynthesis protein CbiX [Rhizobacter sp. Root29]KQV97730.1 cobalamin biosynthesis protein CbiX [Rhizobacter sp. Root1238]KRB18886.1 cobalamin biosynthesis protein CbiX [Rhizobacter sp. Root16D2]